MTSLPMCWYFETDDVHQQLLIPLQKWFVIVRVYDSCSKDVRYLRSICLFLESQPFWQSLQCSTAVPYFMHADTMPHHFAMQLPFP